MRTRATTLFLLASLVGGCGQDALERPPGTIALTSDYQPLVDGYRWAKSQSFAYVFEGDPVGKWYEAALPGREAFCMRDVSHQAVGALALGLADHTKNMMHRFAENIAASRDWCSYWEINRHNQPAPVDYRSDEDFWYNLPANFDVVRSCYEAYEWTGDADYLDDPTFLAFYAHSLTSYVDAWDLDGDGLMESPADNGYRGIPTYWEGRGPRPLTGADLVASQYAANHAYARILTLRGDSSAAVLFRREADRLGRLFNDAWWDPELGRFYTSVLADGTFDTTHIPLLQILPLYFGIVEQGPQRQRLVGNLVEGAIVEVNVYLPEVYFQNGRDDLAFAYLLRQFDPQLPRREYPENPFTAVGTTVRHLMGVVPRASERLVETRPHLPAEVAWVRLEHVPVLENVITVHHVGRTESRIVNEAGSAVRWRAVLPGSLPWVEVDGVPVRPQIRRTEWGEIESYVLVDVPPGAHVIVRGPAGTTTGPGHGAPETARQ